MDNRQTFVKKVRDIVIKNVNLKPLGTFKNQQRLGLVLGIVDQIIHICYTYIHDIKVSEEITKPNINKDETDDGWIKLSDRKPRVGQIIIVCYGDIHGGLWWENICGATMDSDGSFVAKRGLDNDVHFFELAYSDGALRGLLKVPRRNSIHVEGVQYWKPIKNKIKENNDI